MEPSIQLQLPTNSGQGSSLISGQGLHTGRNTDTRKKLRRVIIVEVMSFPVVGLRNVRFIEGKKKSFF